MALIVLASCRVANGDVLGPAFVEVEPGYLASLVEGRRAPQQIYSDDGVPAYLLLGEHPRVTETALPDGRTRVCVAPRALENWTLDRSDDLVAMALDANYLNMESAAAQAERIAAVDADDGNLQRQLERYGFGRSRSVFTRVDAALLALRGAWPGWPRQCRGQDIAGSSRNGMYQYCPDRDVRWVLKEPEEHAWAGGSLPSSVDEQTVFGRYHPVLSRFVPVGDRLIAQYPDGDWCPADLYMPNLRWEATVILQCADADVTDVDEPRLFWSVREMAAQCRVVVTMSSPALCAWARATAALAVPVVPCSIV